MNSRVLTILLALAVQACALQASPSGHNALNTPEIQVEESPLPAASATNTFTPAPLPSPAATNLKTPIPDTSVTITAMNGNLFIRRGPGMEYNQIGVLQKGETASALARDILSKWVQVSFPSNPDQTGWVSIQTKYSSINGELSKLPAVQVDDWPVASYLRNCTYHQMLVMPGDITLPSLLDYPENEVWINPGSYTVYDLDHPDQPQVASGELREGLEIDILVDGNGEKRKCP